MPSPPPAFSAPRVRRSVALVALGLFGAVCAAGLLVGCGSESPEPLASSTARSYQVRGEVRQVPSADRPGSELTLHHEPIHDFVTYQGKREGMDSMTMPFPVDASLLPEGLAVGDKVELTLVVDWEGDDPLRVTALETLPADTELTYGEARPSGGEP